MHDLAPLLDGRLLCAAERGQLLPTPLTAGIGNARVELIGVHARFQGDLERLVRIDLTRDGRHLPLRKALCRRWLPIDSSGVIKRRERGARIS
jgi:hypothetical protein